VRTVFGELELAQMYVGFSFCFLPPVVGPGLPLLADLLYICIIYCRSAPSWTICLCYFLLERLRLVALGFVFLPLVGSATLLSVFAGVVEAVGDLDDGFLVLVFSFRFARLGFDFSLGFCPPSRLYLESLEANCSDASDSDAHSVVGEMQLIMRTLLPFELSTGCSNCEKVSTKGAK
jgi:hypothetical protein